MPEFILPAEADHCCHCEAVLYNPPRCCEAAEADYRDFIEQQDSKWIDKWMDIIDD